MGNLISNIDAILIQGSGGGGSSYTAGVDFFRPHIPNYLSSVAVNDFGFLVANGYFTDYTQSNTPPILSGNPYTLDASTPNVWGGTARYTDQSGTPYIEDASTAIVQDHYLGIDIVFNGTVATALAGTSPNGERLDRNRWDIGNASIIGTSYDGTSDWRYPTPKEVQIFGSPSLNQYGGSNRYDNAPIGLPLPPNSFEYYTCFLYNSGTNSMTRLPSNPVGLSAENISSSNGSMMAVRIIKKTW